ncbi:ABC transporter ATP-binding protein [Acanthopleuribacter pedis]|uniref:ABC transporter ATP-binding protein n=1 Tax=Acanthopleuribacter pedis TaxID=442870 RepID=A0A8J7U4N6_9BACT|nr:ABC transporter ATP-binding protein [Acanthopleuribacter pedis]MBO1319979.1 ABC transporter ATP-binding protein [Acanthopleuribacter pedis]
MEKQPTQAVVELDNVKKRFSSVWGKPRYALKGISFKLNRGEITAFLGPNGAGKTTTKRLIAGYLFPDEGSVRLLGVDPFEQGKQVRTRIGYLPEHNPLYNDLQVIDALQFAAGAKGLRGKQARKAIQEAVESCKLGDLLKQTVGNLSKGTRQRIGLGQAMLGNPEVLLLDEPTNGLDPNQIKDIHLLIRKLACRRTVLLSTHQLHPVPELCDRVLVLNQGHLVYNGATSTLLNQSRTRACLVTDQNPETVRAQLSGLGLNLDPSFKQLPGSGFYSYRIHGTWDDHRMAKTVKQWSDLGWHIGGWHLEANPMEHLFTQLTNNEVSAS